MSNFRDNIFWRRCRGRTKERISSPGKNDKDWIQLLTVDRSRVFVGLHIYSPGDSIGFKMQDSVTERVTSYTKTTGVEVDHVFLQDFREWMSMSSVDELNKELSSFLDSDNISSEEDKIDFLKKILKAFELEYESWLLEKTSQDDSITAVVPSIFRCVIWNEELNLHILESRKWFLNDCEEDGFMEIVRSEFIQRKLAYLQEEIGISDQNTVLNYYDPVAAYLEVFINSIHLVLFSCKCGLQIHDKMAANSSIFILQKHVSRFQLLIQFLTWFHWKSSYT